MQGEDGGEMPIYMELIFCFICRFWRLGCSGLEGSVRMSEREVSWRVFYQAAACMHDKQHTYVGESRHFFTHSHKRQQKVALKVPSQRSLSQMLSTDAERSSGTFTTVDQ